MHSTWRCPHVLELFRCLGRSCPHLSCLYAISPTFLRPKWNWDRKFESLWTGASRLQRARTPCGVDVNIFQDGWTLMKAWWKGEFHEQNCLLIYSRWSWTGVMCYAASTGDRLPNVFAFRHQGENEVQHSQAFQSWRKAYKLSPESTGIDHIAVWSIKTSNKQQLEQRNCSHQLCIGTRKPASLARNAWMNELNMSSNFLVKEMPGYLIEELMLGSSSENREWAKRIVSRSVLFKSHHLALQHCPRDSRIQFTGALSLVHVVSVIRTPGGPIKSFRSLKQLECTLYHVKPYLVLPYLWLRSENKTMGLRCHSGFHPTSRISSPLSSRRNRSAFNRSSLFSTLPRGDELRGADASARGY